VGSLKFCLSSSSQYSFTHGDIDHRKISLGFDNKNILRVFFSQSPIDQLCYFWLWELQIIIIVVLSCRSPIQLDVSLSLSSSLENKFLFFGNLCCYKKEFSSSLPHLWAWLVIEVRNLTFQKGKNDPFLHLNSSLAEYHFCTDLIMFSPAEKKRKTNSAVPNVISYKYQVTNLTMQKCFLRGLIWKDSMGSWQFCWRVRAPASNKAMKSSG